MYGNEFSDTHFILLVSEHKLLVSLMDEHSRRTPGTACSAMSEHVDNCRINRVIRITVGEEEE